MLKNKLAYLAASALTLSALSGPALAQQDMNDWHSDGDSIVTSEEYNAGMDSAGVFDKLDSDGNGSLSEAEFTEGLGDNEQAFNDRFGESWWTDWDADENDELSEDEFNEGTYAGYDADDSGTIEEPEFGDVGDDMGDGGFWDI